MKNWSWKAILGAWALKYFVTTVINFVVWGTMITVLRFGLPGAVALSSPVPFQLWLNILFSVGMNAWGGYLAATWAPSNKFKHAIALGVLSIVINLIFALVGRSDTSALHSFAVAMALPLAALGGWYRVKKHGLENSPKTSTSPNVAPIATP